MRIPLFLTVLVIASFGLIRSDWNEEHVALARWGQSLAIDKEFQDSIASHCSLIVGGEQSDVEATFLRSTNPVRASGTLKRCELRISSYHTSRFFLRASWTYSVQLSAPTGVQIRKSFPVSFALPLALLPLIGWVLAMALSIPVRLSTATCLYLFLAAGMNPTHVTELAWQSMSRMVLIEKNVFGLCILLTWAIALKHSSHIKKVVWPKTVGFLVGIWNPAMLAALFPLQYTKNSIAMGIAEPVICATLSAFFLSLQWENSSFTHLLTPRYFALAILFTVGVRARSLFRSREAIVVSRSFLIQSLLTCAGVFLASLFISGFAVSDRFILVASSLLLGILITPHKLNWRALGTELLLFRWICFGLFVGAFTITSGMAEVVLAFLAPAEQPHASALVTFVSGVSLGLLTGNFSYSYFQILPGLTRYLNTEVVHAALVDGVTAGTLLSPFHPLSLVTFGYFTFKSGLSDVMRERARMAAIPLVIALVVYGLDALGGISILQPITFVFLCLCFGALSLRNRQWSIIVAR